MKKRLYIKPEVLVVDIKTTHILCGSPFDDPDPFEDLDPFEGLDYGDIFG